MTPLPTEPEWLAQPAVSFFKDDAGRIEAAYVQLRKAKAVRAEQPNEAVQVYFYLGADDLPVGLKFLEPVEGVAVCEIVSTLVKDHDGTPVGVGHAVKHSFLTSFEDVARLMAVLGKANRGLEPSAH